MKFSNMNGYEFEDFIVKLFRKMGFRVEPTNYSGDGGIDLVAYYDKPIFRGKYVIECTNRTSDVGQPAVRDLYGVTISEKANKGILITTSSFTNQAVDFAYEKNIELIDGKQLIQLVEEILDKKIIFEDNNKDDFLKASGFNLKKYQYYIKQIETDRKNETYYKELDGLLLSYIYNGLYDGEYNGILDAYLEITDKQIKNCYSTKGKLEQKEWVLVKQTFVHFLKGEWVKMFEVMKIIRPRAFGIYGCGNETCFLFPDSSDHNLYLISLYSFFKCYKAEKTCEYFAKSFFNRHTKFSIVRYIAAPFYKTLYSFHYMDGDANRVLDFQTIISKIPKAIEKREELEKFMDII